MKNNQSNEMNESDILEILLKQRQQIEAGQERLKEQKESPVIRITSAHPLSQQDKEVVLRALERIITFEQDDIQYIVDARLIAGIRIQSRSYYYDNSLLRKLEDMRHHLISE
ncbi:MAG: F0F1 ATP synthase subunit delta [Atopococcus tabaci]|uniref:F0F1 ATP synthase subunit delta n=1 Tax=Atopococcus tabaci TaxID=269774 RepID=A0AA43UC41_9LACT|nr:F0F1 ATP synthase subunit delta [Atopococcus tabaci]